MISVLSYRKQGFPFLFNIFFIKEKLGKQTFESDPTSDRGKYIQAQREKRSYVCPGVQEKSKTVSLRI